MSEELDQTLSLHHYLYLHPSENLVVAHVSPFLDSTNYHSWSRSMFIALSAKNKVEFINGVVQLPSISDPLYNAWLRCNNMVVSWIVRSVVVSIRHNILLMDKTDEIWIDLHSLYSQRDLLRMLDLLYEASSMIQGDLFVTDFFTTSDFVGWIQTRLSLYLFYQVFM